MALRADPMGGGQFAQAIKTIMDAERQPVRNLENRKKIEDTKIKLFGDFKTKFNGLDKHLVDLTSLKRFRELKVDLGNGEKLMSASVDKERAEVGSYELTIDELAYRSSIISNNFKDPNDANLGIGFIVMNLADGGYREIFVTESNASLNKMANLINSEPGSPVQASVVRDEYEADKPWRLVITAKKDGAASRVDFPQFYFLDGREDFYIDDDRDSRNAQITLDGFEIETSGNDVPDFLTGVNIQLKAASPGETFMMKITPDHDKMTAKMKGFIDQLNQVLEFVIKQNAIDESTDTRSTFAGDSGLQMIEYKIRNLVHGSYGVFGPEADPYEDDPIKRYRMSELGVQFERNGLLSFKEDKFKKVLQADFEGVAQVLSGAEGFATNFRRFFQAYTQTGNGILGQKDVALKSRIRQIDDQIATRERHLARKEQMLTEKFSRLQGTLNDLQRQQSYMQATLGGSGGGGSVVQQLIG